MRAVVLAVVVAASGSHVEHWTGTGHQYDPDSHWTIDLRFDPDTKIGGTIGTIAYPSLGCSGELVREADARDDLVFREHITHDPDHHCVTGGAMLIPRARGQTFHWRWRWPGSNELGADATLRRR